MNRNQYKYRNIYIYIYFTSGVWRRYERSARTREGLGKDTKTTKKKSIYKHEHEHKKRGKHSGKNGR